MWRVCSAMSFIAPGCAYGKDEQIDLMEEWKIDPALADRFDHC